jgi:hypothetical protein
MKRRDSRKKELRDRSMMSILSLQKYRDSRIGLREKKRMGT